VSPLTSTADETSTLWEADEPGTAKALENETQWGICEP